MSKAKTEQIDQSDAEYVLCVIGTPTLYLKPYSPQFGWTLGPLLDAKCFKSIQDAWKLHSHVIASSNGKSFTMLKAARLTKTVHHVKVEA